MAKKEKQQTENELSDTVKKALADALKVIPLFPVGSCLGVPYGLLEYDKNERETILLVEERSIELFKYRDTVHLVLDQIRKDIESGNFDSHEIDVNKFGVCGIVYAKQVVFFVQYKEANMKIAYLPEETVINQNTKTADKITISISINPKKYSERLLSRLLFHELNHAKDDVSCLMNNTQSFNVNVDDTYGGIKYQKVYHDFNDLNNELRYIPYLIHNLFVDTEFNAIVSEIYADFEHSVTHKDYFYKELKNTETYKRYSGFKEIIKQIEEDKGWESYAISYFNNKGCTKEQFRLCFIEKAKRRVSEYWYRMGKEASKLFTKQQIEENAGNNIVHDGTVATSQSSDTTNSNPLSVAKVRLF